MSNSKLVKDQVNRSYLSFSIKPLILATLLTSVAYAEFIPATEPVIRIRPPKPNIIVILDQSGSMGRAEKDPHDGGGPYLIDYWEEFANAFAKDRTVMIGTRKQWHEYKDILPYGVGQAIIDRMVRKNAGRIKFGFSHFNYINPQEPSDYFWLRYNNNNPPHPQYPDKTGTNATYLSFDAVNKGMSGNVAIGSYSGVRYPITELLDPVTGKNHADAAIEKIYELEPVNVDNNSIHKMPMHTYANTIYDMTKILRGHGVVQKIDLVNAIGYPGKPEIPGINFDLIPTTATQTGVRTTFESWGKPTWKYYPNPQKFRCEQSHIITISIVFRHLRDGIYGVLPTDWYLSNGSLNPIYERDGLAWNIPKERLGAFNVGKVLSGDKVRANIADGYDIVSRNQDLTKIGLQISHLDLRKDGGRVGTVGERKGFEGKTDVDMGNMPWYNPKEPRSKITLHGIKIGAFLPPTGENAHQTVKLKGMANVTGGVFSEALTPKELDDTFTQIIDTVLPPLNVPKLIASNGQSLTKNTVFYQSDYDPFQWTSRIRAVGNLLGVSVWYSTVLWDTEDTLEARCIQHGPFGARCTKAPNSMVNSIRVADGTTSGLFNPGATKYKELQDFYIEDGKDPTQSLNYYYGRYLGKLITRPTPLGSIINSTFTTLLPDSLYSNTEALSKENAKILNDNLVTRSSIANNSYVVGGSSDGLLNFISIESDLKPTRIEDKDLLQDENADNGQRAESVSRVGRRDIALLPYFFGNKKPATGTPMYNFETAARELGAGKHNFRMDGSIGFMDGIIKVGAGLKPITVGLAMYGSGGNGYLGFKVSNVENPTLSSKSLNGITPLYEKYPNSDSNLGYTYSSVEYANIRESASADPRIIALFGNGFGASGNRSSLWIIDAVTGDELTEISLGTGTGIGTGGASSPALIVKNNTATGFQSLDRAYVGDLQGNLYKITFADSITGTHTVKQIFTTEGNQPITAQPRVITDSSGIDWVYFGTGALLRESDRYDSSGTTKQNYFYGLRFDKNGNPIGAKGVFNDHSLSSGGYEMAGVSEVDIVGATQTTNGELDLGFQGWRITLDKGEHILQPSASYYDKFIVINTYGLVLGDEEGIDQCRLDTEFSKILIVDRNTGNSGEVFGHSGKGGGVSAKGRLSNLVGAGIMSGNPYSGQGSNTSPSMEAIKLLGAKSQHSPENNPPCAVGGHNIAYAGPDAAIRTGPGYCVEDSKAGRISFERKY